MSLTSLLDQADSSVRLFLMERFPLTRPVAAHVKATLSGVATIRPAESVPWSLLGHAVDFRLRGYFAPVSFTDIPATGAQQLWGPAAWEFHEEVGTELDTHALNLGSVGRRLDRDSEEWLARFCLALSLFETVYRSGKTPLEIAALSPESVTAETLLAIPPQVWVDDLCALSWAFYDQHVDLLTKPATLNPNFDGSEDVGGADADLVLDGCLLDVKTTINPQCLHAEWFYQLLGYVLLDHRDRHAIREVGIYFARQAAFVRWPLEELMRTMAGTDVPPLDELRADFKRAAKKARV